MACPDLLEVFGGDFVDGQPVGDHVAGFHTFGHLTVIFLILVGVPHFGLEVDAIVLRLVVNACQIVAYISPGFRRGAAYAIGFLIPRVTESYT